MADAKTMTILDPNGNVLSTVYLKDQWAREQIGTINSSLTQLPLIQRGCKKNVSLTASGQTEVNVALDTPITSDYIVCANIVFYGSANTFALIVRDRGQSSFTLRVYNSNNVAVSVEIDWIAIPV